MDKSTDTSQKPSPIVVEGKGKSEEYKNADWTQIRDAIYYESHQVDVHKKTDPENK